MYRITCDGHPILDMRDDALIVANPRVRNEVNTVGEGSFTIFDDHPHYDKLQILKSLIEVSDEYGVIFRGRMTENTKDFYKRKAVDLEGAMAFFNDSVVRDYKFPDDFEKDAAYIDALGKNQVPAFYLAFLIDQHNEQVAEFQRFKLGNVTVYGSSLERATTELPSTWEELKQKLFESSLGGNLCIRYEADGNYIDYLAEFTEVNEQGIDLEENLLDLTHNEDGTETYSAIIPRGAEVESKEEGSGDYVGVYGSISGDSTVKKRLTLADLPDGDITDDIAKIGDTLYSKSAVDKYGWRYAPRDESLWEDVTIAENLLDRGVDFLEGNATKIPNTFEVTAADLHFSDSQIRSFRIYRKINVNSSAHGISGDFDLTALDIPLLEPQNTKIKVGKTVYTLTKMQSNNQGSIITLVEKRVGDVALATDAVVEIVRTEFKDLGDSIVLEVGKTYATKDELGNYVTSGQLTSAVEVAVGRIDLSVYATKDALDDYAKQSDLDAFATMDEVKSEIDVEIGRIDLSVYATTEDMEKVEGSLSLKLDKDDAGTVVSLLTGYANDIEFTAKNKITFNSNSFYVKSGDNTQGLNIGDGGITCRNNASFADIAGGRIMVSTPTITGNTIYKYATIEAGEVEFNRKYIYPSNNPYGYDPGYMEEKYAYIGWLENECVVGVQGSVIMPFQIQSDILVLNATTLGQFRGNWQFNTSLTFEKPVEFACTGKGEEVVVYDMDGNSHNLRFVLSVLKLQGIIT